MSVRVFGVCEQTHMSLCVHARAGWREQVGGNGVEEGEGSSPQVTDWGILLCLESHLAGAGSRVGSERGEMTVSGFCLDERKFFGQGNSPPWGVPPLWVTGNSGEPSHPLQTNLH